MKKCKGKAVRQYGRSIGYNKPRGYGLGQRIGCAPLGKVVVE